MSLSNQTNGLIVGLILGLILGGAGVFFLVPGGQPTGTPSYTITSSGSTTVLPLSQEWSERVTDTYPNIQFNPSGGGSGQGQADAAAGEVDIGASSSYPGEDYATNNPNVDILPVSADALAIVANTNVNGSTFKMDCDMAVAIFSAQITTWENFESTFGVSIQATGDINVYVRSDESGTTATFTKWLETVNDTAGMNGEDFYWTYGHDEAMSWAEGLTGAQGNPGVANSVKDDENGIGYVGFAFTEALTTISLWNPGNQEWVEATTVNALKAIPSTINDPGVNLFNSDSVGAYPIARLLFYLVPRDTLDWYTIIFLDWALSQGQQYIDDVGYLAIEGTAAWDYSVEVLADMTPAS